MFPPLGKRGALSLAKVIISSHIHLKSIGMGQSRKINRFILDFKSQIGLLKKHSLFLMLSLLETKRASKNGHIFKAN